MRQIKLILLGLAAMVCVLAALDPSPARAEEDLAPLVAILAEGGLSERAEAIDALAATGDPRAVPILEALADGALMVRKADGAVVIAKTAGKVLALTDPVTGVALAEVASGALDKIKVNNRLRRSIRDAVGALTLRSKDTAVRLIAAKSLFDSADPESIEALEGAIGVESDSTVRTAMERALAASILASDLPEDRKLAAVTTITALGGRDALSVLTPLANGEDAVAAAARKAMTAINNTLALWDAGQAVWYGLSLGSVLLLAAIGLAITFGVMGVINMAHGEMVMLGAYTTFMVQDVIRTSIPGLFEWSLLIALPLAFLVTGAIGVAIERGIIRFLYGRPLETLLATWGLSLVLQQVVRSIFGPTNQEVGTPEWMSGAFKVGEMTITYNRLTIIIFAMAVLFCLMLVLKKTPMGLQMRAVTQNRRMAGSMGIRTNWVDAMTFGLGSGIAGIAGVALSQVDNVSPNLGQGYIIDSFMVVVFGGVGNLWGTLVGAMTLGIANKFLEPYAGAVLGKILVLVFIILFIQKRPRGLFALKGRAVES
ncbi:MAG: urea ABC transporter permease subunit UrtB [Rhodospirillum sp.]|nr:urea ABC transporter permease subunit UrtB [Rhodospirillum sp.]MCF8488287.1 urea ABC transporter permease subunit UrtB [Rhodospirillum sp.]MCF8500057.1 urea ABC transporter permease subunit UrtB [Rhodospirillum sp.]